MYNICSAWFLDIRISTCSTIKLNTLRNILAAPGFAWFLDIRISTCSTVKLNTLRNILKIRWSYSSIVLPFQLFMHNICSVAFRKYVEKGKTKVIKF